MLLGQQQNLGWKGAKQSRKLVREIWKVKVKEVEPAPQQDRNGRQNKDDLLPPHRGRSQAWEGGQGAEPLRKHWPPAQGVGCSSSWLRQTPLETSLCSSRLLFG